MAWGFDVINTCLALTQMAYWWHLGRAYPAFAAALGGISAARRSGLVSCWRFSTDTDCV